MKMNVYLLTKEKTSVRLIKSEEEKKIQGQKNTTQKRSQSKLGNENFGLIN